MFEPGQHVLLAISGGPDSVALVHLLKNCRISFALAHCNFKLRGKDSDADEAFCKQLAKQQGLEIYTKQFDTKEFAQRQKMSIQLAARQLRYDWFYELLEKEWMNSLVTAHHASDVTETVLINLLRGTGIKGLKGIPEKTDWIIRPLLPFTKEEILQYLKANNINYRLDKSNAEDKYERNFLRLKVIPLLKELQPNLDQVMLNNIANFKEEAAMVKKSLEKASKRILRKKKEQLILDKAALAKEKHIRSILHQNLGPLGFNATQLENIETNIRKKGLVGKMIYSPTHALTIDRNELVIKANLSQPAEQIVLHTLSEIADVPYLKLHPLKKFSPPAQNELVVDASTFIFPLTLRGKQKGDRFKPFGMKGFKLLSDFLKDQKLNNFEKESCKLLVNGNGEIIWVLGYRSDERYRVTAESRDLIKLSFIG